MENFQESQIPSGKQISEIVKQRYKIERKIGEGGFAETFLAYDLESGTQCVLKILSWKDVPDWKVIELFEREARVLSQIRHPQIPRFLEFFTEKSETETQIILVQEYIAGKNLAQSILDGKHYTEQEVIRIGLQAVTILEHLQDFSPPIIHRDIKPSNLLQSEDGDLHLVDFGAVRDRVLHHQKTEAGGFTVVGTYGFMPFEQFQGQAVPASDIYSLGMTLITLLSHKEPHEMELNGSDIDFEPFVNISTGLKAVLRKMIAHRLEDRYSSARQLRRDLEAVLAGNQPEIIRSKTRKISSGTLVMLLLVLFVIWFAAVRKPVVVPPIKASQPVASKTALRPPYTGKVARGSIFFDGQQISDITNVRPSFWFRDETKGSLVTAEAFYSNGEFEFRGLPPGTYGASIQLDTNEKNPSSFPGDLRAWQQFAVVQDADTVMRVDLLKIIHIVKPEDNNLVLRNWNRCCEDGKPLHTRDFHLEWTSLGKDVFYDYKINRLICPYQAVESVASGTTDQTSVKLNLPSSKPKEYYLLELYARKEGRRIGMLMTHGANGHGWDYRFRTD